MTPRRRGLIARVLAGAVVGLGVGLLYDRNTREFVPADAGIDWGAVVAAAVTLGTLLLAYEVLAWMVRSALETLRRRSHKPSVEPPNP